MANPLLLSDATGRAIESAGHGELIHYGSSVPADDTPGFSHGCYFIVTSDSSVPVAYVNHGAKTACNFAPQPAVDGEFVFGTTSDSPPTLTRRVLSSSHPDLCGVSPSESPIKFAADGTVTPDAVNIPSTLTNSSVSRLTIDGQYTQSATGQGADSESPDIGDGVHNDGTECFVHNNVIQGFRGSCVVADGRTFVRENYITDGYKGIYIFGAADCQVTGNYVFSQRDAGLHADSSSGPVQSTSNHYFGCNNGDGVGNKHTESATSPGAACWVDGASVFVGINDIYADSYYGLKCSGALSEFVGCHLQHNTYRDVYFSAPGDELLGCLVRGMARTDEYPDTVSVEFATERCGILGGALEATGYSGNLTNPIASETLHLSTGADGCMAWTRLIDGDGDDDSIGVRAKAPVIGGQYTFRTYGFHDTDAKMLIIDAAATSGTNTAGSVGMRGCTFEFFGIPTGSSPSKTNIDTTDPTKYVTVPSDIHRSNEVWLHNTTTGQKTMLTGSNLLTIASGAITPIAELHRIAGEGASADDLDTINGGYEGRRLTLRAASSSVTITVKDGTNLKLAGGDFALDNEEDTISFIYDSALAKWLETSRSDNGA